MNADVVNDLLNANSSYCSVVSSCGVQDCSVQKALVNTFVSVQDLV